MAPHYVGVGVSKMVLLVICADLVWLKQLCTVATSEGRKHDAMLLRLSGLLGQLQSPNFYDDAGNVLYGDPTREHLIFPFKGDNISDIVKTFNMEMSKVRQCIE